MFRIHNMLLAALLLALVPAADTLAGHRDCCVSAPSTTQTLCVVNPCTGCATDVCVCVPCCCVGDAVLTCCRNGVFGRKILTYTWPSCGHSVEVVATRRGVVRVR